MTAKEARSKLFKLIQTIFTKTFLHKYSMLAYITPESDALEIVDYFEEQTTSYISLMTTLMPKAFAFNSEVAKHGGEPFSVQQVLHFYLEELAQVADAKVIYCVHMRYNFIVGSLAKCADDKEFQFPKDDVDFFCTIFTDYWHSTVQGEMQRDL